MRVLFLTLVTMIYYALFSEIVTINGTATVMDDFNITLYSVKVQYILPMV